jgi:hypothetical protein
MKLISIVVSLEAEDIGVKFVVQKPDGSPAVGAAIACGALSAVTDAEGVAIIGPLAAGSYDYTVTLEGYKPASGTVVVA